MKRRRSLSLYHYLLTAGLSSGQISKSICPRFHSENRERDGWREDLSSHKGREEREGREGREGVICWQRKRDKQRNTLTRDEERDSSFLKERERNGSE